MSMYSERVIEKKAQFKPGQKRSKPRMLAYPRYDRSLVSQRRQHPVRSGMIRGAETGLTGAALGALIARVISDRPRDMAIGGLAGGLLGAVPGYMSGKQEAESENSRLLFLRRRLGINEPGELETALQNPTLTRMMADNREMDKAASHVKRAGPKAALATRAIIGAIVGGISGHHWGWNVSPELSGYADVESARKLSRMSGVLTGGMLGGLIGASGKSGRAVLSRYPKSLPAKMVGAVQDPRFILGIPTGLVAGEVLPSVIASQKRQSDALKEQATGQVAPTVTRALASRAGKGALAGTALAGLAGMSTGLTRARTDDEIRKDKSRMEMIKSDIMKYVVPAAIGGGVVGSAIK